MHTLVRAGLASGWPIRTSPRKHPGCVVTLGHSSPPTFLDLNPTSLYVDKNSQVVLDSEHPTTALAISYL